MKVSRRPTKAIFKQYKEEVEKQAKIEAGLEKELNDELAQLT